jgi:hypothetical protein
MRNRPCQPATGRLCGCEAATRERRAAMGDAAPTEADDEAIAAGLRTRLAQIGRLPGERALATELGVTRHRLRGALARLRSEGALGAPNRRRNGRARRDETMVRETNPIEVIELRMVLEPPLARLAALRASPADIARIRRAATTWGEDDAGSIDRATGWRPTSTRCYARLGPTRGWHCMPRDHCARSASSSATPSTALSLRRSRGATRTAPNRRCARTWRQCSGRFWSAWRPA